MAASASQRTSADGFEVLAPTTSTPQSLSQAVRARRAEFTRAHSIKVKIGTWNVAACPATEKDLGAWFVDGKGIEEKLTGLRLPESFEGGDIESVHDQEARRRKKESTYPKGDSGAVVGGDKIGLYVLGLQEIVDLNHAQQYIGKIYVDPGPAAKWRKALVDALPSDYVVVSERQLSGLLTFVVASPEVAPTVSSVCSVSIGTGLAGYLGNKGAISTRIVLGDTTRLVFVNSHLASGPSQKDLERRCWDFHQVIERTRFDPINWSGVLDDKHECLGDEDFAFWFGDLNFRLDGLPGDDIRRLLMLHTKGLYAVDDRPREKIENELESDKPIVTRCVDSDDESEDDRGKTSSTFDPRDDTSSGTFPDPDEFVDPSQDPTSLQATIDSLLPHDQLRQVQKAHRAFDDGWREGTVTFLPTYKYDVGSMGMFDSSEKKRAPSWCDRILFRTQRDKLEADGKVSEAALTRMKDEEMKARGLDHATDDEEILFDYDPDEDGADETPPAKVYDEYIEADEVKETVLTKEGALDRIRLDVYTSHQRILSSDHKPLDAVFTLDYDAAVPELRSRIQQEVARELDRAENECRPGITIVVDHSYDEIPRADTNPSEKSSGGDVGVDFGNVEFLHRKIRSVTIANTSQVSCSFAFADRPSTSDSGDDRIAPTWLSVCFVGSELDEDDRIRANLERQVTLQPGDAVNATLELLVNDIALVKPLNDGTIELDDVLVLRVRDGRDHFIPVRGSWCQSCLSRSIDELIRIPEGGVRGIQIPPPPKQREICWSAPRELFKLTEAMELLTERVIADANMLENAQIPREHPGWPFDSKSWQLRDNSVREFRKGLIIQALDADRILSESFPQDIPSTYRLEIVAEVLLMFLNSLTDGVVTATLWDKLEFDMVARGPTPLVDGDDIRTWVLDVLSSSPNHNISFVFLTSMLQRVASELAPVPKTRQSLDSMSTFSSIGSLNLKGSMRRSLSWNRKAVGSSEDPVAARRQAVDAAFAGIFSSVIFRGPLPSKDKEKRLMDDRRKEILEVFVRSPGSGG